MQTLLVIAAALAVLTGVAHSVLGELLIFRHFRRGTLVPAESLPPLKSRNIRILWATWHLATVFGWAFAFVLARVAFYPEIPITESLAIAATAAYGGGALLVLVGTRGRHPGWIALGAVALLTCFALLKF